MKKTPKRLKKPVNRPDDALAIAALRNFALDVERLLVRIYVTDPTKYQKLVLLMRTMLHEIYKAGTDARLCKVVKEKEGPARRLLSEESCPPGWELCSDGLCAEVCYLADFES